MEGLTRRERRRLRMDQPGKEKPAEAPIVKQAAPRHSRYKGLLGFYHSHYKQLLIITIVFLILSITQVGYQIARTGNFISVGVSLTGGTTITIPTDKDMDLVQLRASVTSALNNNDIDLKMLSSGGVPVALIVEAPSSISKDILIQVLAEKTGIPKDTYTVEVMGSSLGKSFFKEVVRAMIFAFILMGIVVFAYFRIPIPSLAVILCAFSDIIGTIAVFNVMGFKLSTSGIAALLMLIGYSVDTDILLTTRVLKRKEGTVEERITNAAKTGLTMTLTTISAVLVALIFSKSEALTQIMTILMIGLIFDMFFTWIQNVGLIRLYLERKHGQN